MIGKTVILALSLLLVVLITSCSQREPLAGEEQFLKIKKTVAREDWRGFCQFLDQDSLAKTKKECPEGSFSEQTKARLKESILNSFYVDYLQRGEQSRIFVKNKSGIKVLYLRNGKIVLP